MSYDHRQTGYIPRGDRKVGKCIGGSRDGRRLESHLATFEDYMFYPARTVHGVSYGFWYPQGKTPTDIILELTFNYRAKRVKK